MFVCRISRKFVASIISRIYCSKCQWNVYSDKQNRYLFQHITEWIFYEWVLQISLLLWNSVRVISDSFIPFFRCVFFFGGFLYIIGTEKFICHGSKICLFHSQQVTINGGWTFIYFFRWKRRAIKNNFRVYCYSSFHVMKFYCRNCWSKTRKFSQFRDQE